jgi:argininosuccinate lyase
MRQESGQPSILGSLDWAVRTLREGTIQASSRQQTFPRDRNPGIIVDRPSGESLPMTDEARITNLLSYIGKSDNAPEQSDAKRDERQEPRSDRELQAALWAVMAAHAVELRKSEVIDDVALSAIGQSLQRAAGSTLPEWQSARRVIDALEAQVESQLPATVAGVATLGLSREEWLATAGRMAWRERLLDVAAELSALSHSVQVLAEAHSVTLMPGFAGGKAIQPTMLGHFLGGLLSPLARARQRLQGSYAAINRSPLGAGMLAGDVVAADRGDLAERLGFDGIVPNTFDALSSIEDVVEALDAMEAAIAPVARFVRELQVWIRTDPTSFVIDERWLSIPEPAHPSLVFVERLEHLERRLDESMEILGGLRRQLRRVPYGPLGTAHDLVIEGADRAGGAMSDALVFSRELIDGALIVNRAYLGNRAGRGYTTAPDLAAFLMTEEQIPPVAARRIAVLVLAGLKETGLEVSGITPDAIDSAALMTIGREIKVEMETLGRFLAPRRYLERRQVTGSAAPEMIREWLAEERSQLATHREWAEMARRGLTSAEANLRSLIDEAASEDLEG